MVRTQNLTPIQQRGKLGSGRDLTASKERSEGQRNAIMKS